MDSSVKRNIKFKRKEGRKEDKGRKKRRSRHKTLKKFLTLKRPVNRGKREKTDKRHRKYFLQSKEENST